jgi:hypothetical protein
MAAKRIFNFIPRRPLTLDALPAIGIDGHDARRQRCSSNFSACTHFHSQTHDARRLIGRDINGTY